MTYYDISYASYTGKERIERAVQDCWNYLGDNPNSSPEEREAFESKKAIIIEACQEAENLGALRFALSFAGIQGYPVYALAFTYNNDLLSASDLLSMEKTGAPAPEA